MKKFVLILTIASLSNSLFTKVYAQPLNDNISNAIDVTSLINTCSDDEEYTNEDATADGQAASNWNTNPNYNVWFKFQATTEFIQVVVKRGDDYGDIRKINLALWEPDGVTELASKRYNKEKDDVTIVCSGLVIGSWYYIAVDNKDRKKQGSFTLCLSDTPDYDYYEGAIDVSSIIDSHSEYKEYTTKDATADKLAASTWNTNPDYNRWFKFQATSQHMEITVDRGGKQGSIKCVNLALWQADGVTEIASARYKKKEDDVTVKVENSLIPGNWYYISVDNKSAKNKGTFTLYLDDLVDGVMLATSNGSGGGLWNDPTSWANGQIPALNSNVVISPSDSIIINSNILVGTLNISGDLTTTSPTDNFIIEVKGDVLNNGIFETGNCEVKLSGGANQSISGSYYDLNVSKTGGNVLLSGNLNISNSLALNNGNLLLNQYNLNISNTASNAIQNGSNVSYIIADSSGVVSWNVAKGNSMQFPIGDVNDYTPFTFTLNNGVLNSAKISLKITDSKHNQMANGNYLTRYWTLEPTGITNPDYSVSYTYTDADVVGDESLIYPAKFHSEWLKGSQAADIASNTLTWNNITSFSDFSGGGGGALPVELVEFKVELKSSSVKLAWITASEKNNDYFSVERSNNGIDYKTIDIVNGSGNSNRLIEYELTDNEPLQGVSYYRIKQTDFDGKYEYSEVVSISNGGLQNVEAKIYPNPVQKNSQFTVSINGLTNDVPVTIELRNCIGNLMKTRTLNSQNDSSEVIIDTYDIPSGLYFVNLIQASDMTTQKLIIQ